MSSLGCGSRCLRTPCASLLRDANPRGVRRAERNRLCLETSARRAGPSAASHCMTKQATAEAAGCLPLEDELHTIVREPTDRPSACETGRAMAACGDRALAPAASSLRSGSTGFSELFVPVVPSTHIGKPVPVNRHTCAAQRTRTRAPSLLCHIFTSEATGSPRVFRVAAVACVLRAADQLAPDVRTPVSPTRVAARRERTGVRPRTCIPPTIRGGAPDVDASREMTDRSTARRRREPAYATASVYIARAVRYWPSKPAVRRRRGPNDVCTANAYGSHMDESTGTIGSGLGTATPHASWTQPRCADLGAWSSLR
ncbi:hypothetical protein OH77DRAFT_152232 [Trametes cingulata]|nr:hypothetical protein OH77DRAFT_152232 [Trametes cingulata]